VLLKNKKVLKKSASPFECGANGEAVILIMSIFLVEIIPGAPLKL
jgi:hypothetical protein